MTEERTPHPLAAQGPSPQGRGQKKKALSLGETCKAAQQRDSKSCPAEGAPQGRKDEGSPSTSLGHLYLVATPRPGQAEGEFLARVEAALDGGVDTLQLRCKDGEARAYVALAEKVGELARARGVPFFVNDRVDVAYAAEADGVHLGQGDLPVKWARALAPGLLIGRSTHRADDAARALAEAPTYFATGPVHATPTKPGRVPAGLAYVRHVAALRPALPWYAIGGIDLSNVREVLAAGATRVAVVRAILDAPDPAAAAAAFRQILEETDHASER